MINQYCSCTGGWSKLLGFHTFSEGIYLTNAPYRSTSLMLSAGHLEVDDGILYLPRL